MHKRFLNKQVGRKAGTDRLRCSNRSGIDVYLFNCSERIGHTSWTGRARFRNGSGGQLERRISIFSAFREQVASHLIQPIKRMEWLLVHSGIDFPGLSFLSSPDLRTFHGRFPPFPLVWKWNRRIKRKTVALFEKTCKVCLYFIFSSMEGDK